MSDKKTLADVMTASANKENKGSAAKKAVDTLNHLTQAAANLQASIDILNRLTQKEKK